MWDEDDFGNAAYENMRLERKHRKSRQEFKAEEKAKAEMYSRLYKYTKNKEKKMTTFNIKKRDNAPDFVVGSFGCKLGDLEPFVNSKGYINFDILKGKENGMYVKINEYGLNNKEENVTSISDDEINF